MDTLDIETKTKSLVPCFFLNFFFKRSLFLSGLSKQKSKIKIKTEKITKTKHCQIKPIKQANKKPWIPFRVDKLMWPALEGC